MSTSDPLQRQSPEQAVAAPRNLSLGLFLAAQHVQGPLARRLDEHLEQVVVARESGFSSVVAGQHYFSNPFQMLHPVPLLARVAAEAGDMYVGTGILLGALYNPVEIADLTATMDAVCHGRFILGLGLGYRDVEYGAFNVSPAKRVPNLEEALKLVPSLLAGGPITHLSDRVALAAVEFPSRPAQSPRPPIWLAANNDPAVRRAARLADCWLLNPHAKLSVLRRQMALYRSERARVGKLPPAVVPMIKEVYCADTDREAWNEAKPFLEEKYRTYVKWGQQRALPEHEDELDLPFDSLQGDRFIVGDPDTVTAQIDRYRTALGVDHVLVRTQWAGRHGSLDQAKVLHSIQLLGTRVLPHFRAGATAPYLGSIDPPPGPGYGGGPSVDPAGGMDS